jgi:hypothetical protein
MWTWNGGKYVDGPATSRSISSRSGWTVEVQFKNERLTKPLAGLYTWTTSKSQQPSGTAGADQPLEINSLAVRVDG